jgi:uncharacterized protein (DUF885 family)
MTTRLRLLGCGLLCLAPSLPMVRSQDSTLQNPSPPGQLAASQSSDAKGPVENSAALATKSSGNAISQLISQYAADQKTLGQRFRIPLDHIGQEYRTKMIQSWESKLASIDFEKLDRDNQIDWLLLDSKIRHDRELQERKEERNAIAKVLIPYSDKLLQFCASKEHGTQLTAEDAASLLDTITNQANELTKGLQKSAKEVEKSIAATSTAAAVAPTVAIDASVLLDQFSRQMQDTHRYYEGYDPKYSWWASKPFEATKSALANHRKAIREKLAGLDDSDNDKIVGVPIGDAALLKELRYAWIPYTPQELIAIGEKEMQWCEDRFKEAADELKLDGDWRKALEQVKSLHVEPGDQPRLIRELAWEAIRFLEGNDLITVPEMAKHGWRVEMMTPEAQRVNPYFLGGDNIIVSFPTSTMTHSEKLMSLKSNNIHFCRATVHHELIPGHHLQYYSLARYRPYRDLFSSPFWMEGWALYWEMALWDMGFAQSPEDRVGMLFWRKHRAARIIFSLNYQSGKWTAEECVKYLIDRVGHEPSAAAAEVRRSIMGGYGPLYQAGYMLGGLQLRSLQREVVQAGKMTNRQFHDAVLQENHVPFELLRTKMLDMPLSNKQLPKWRFYDK